MDREPELLEILKARGPISVKRLNQLTGLSRRCINGTLHRSKFTKKVETRPLSRVSTRPVWSWSPTPVRPVKAVRRIEEPVTEDP